MKKNIIFAGLFILMVITVIAFSARNSNNSGNQFETNTRGLPEAQPSKVVSFNDGDVYNLTASMVKKNINGNEVKMLAYNGSIPGPTLKVSQGSSITINFKNDTDVETTLHSHGLRLQNEFDGVPDITQDAIPPGGSFVYKLTFPDVGAYWYHPHLREDYAQELGLYGNFLVTPKNPAYWNSVHREVPLFLDDILFAGGKVAPFYKKGATNTLMGRFGNVMLVNGETDYILKVKQGEVVRFYLTNSANVRPFRFALEGTRMKVVGGDSGAYEREEWQDTVTLGPSERVIVEALFDTAGEIFLQNKTPKKTTILGKVVVESESSVKQGGTSGTLRSNLETIKSIDPFRPFFTKIIDKQISLLVSMQGSAAGMSNSGGEHMMQNGSMMSGGMAMSAPAGGIEWEDEEQMMGGVADTNMASWNILDKATGKKNMSIDWKFKVGDKIKIRIFNDPKSLHPMQHPIHFHGQRFLVLNKNGIEQKNLVWKDTVLVPADEYVDILLDISNPGDWMAHCHIPEHLEAGMMFLFKVEK